MSWQQQQASTGSRGQVAALILGSSGVTVDEESFVGSSALGPGVPLHAVLLLAVGLGALRLSLLDLLLNIAVAHLLRLVHVVFVIARARDDFRSVAKEDDITRGCLVDLRHAVDWMVLSLKSL